MKTKIALAVIRKQAPALAKMLGLVLLDILAQGLYYGASHLRRAQKEFKSKRKVR